MPVPSLMLRDRRGRLSAPRFDGDAAQGSDALGEVLPDENTWARQYRVTFQINDSTKLGLDMEYAPENRFLPIVAITGGLAEDWNQTHAPKLWLRAGDRIIAVNSYCGSAEAMVAEMNLSKTLEITLIRSPPNRSSNFPRPCVDCSCSKGEQDRVQIVLPSSPEPPVAA